MRRILAAAIVWAVCSGAPCWALNGSDLVLNSSGATYGSAAQLAGTGYVGTYIDVSDAGGGGSTVNLTMSAGRASGGSGDYPHMNIVVADSKFGYTVSDTSAADFSTGDVWLPAGTYCVRLERDSANDPSSSTYTAQVNGLTVSGASFANEQTDANALAAANTYIDNFRKGPADVTLVGAALGADVQVKLKRHAFNFGTNIHGWSDTGLLNANPTPGSTADKYQQFINTHFNMVEPSNGAKWDSTEPNQGNVRMAWSDKIFQYAEDHGMRTRQHNLIWGNQQPSWVNSLITSAGGGSATALTNLTNAINNRIDYYVADRAQHYTEMDVYNESVHTGVNRDPSYWSLYGAGGISEIFDNLAQAVSAAGGDTKLFLNEYGVLQNAGDAYGNWYREHIEEIENADGDPSDNTVSGIGIQYYAGNGHSAVNMQQVLQNMSVTGLPLTLTEFGVHESVTDEGTVLEIVDNAIRMMFGTPDANAFLYWGWGQNFTSSLQSASIMVDSNFDLTAAGRLYEDLLGIHDWDGDPSNGWTTDLTLPVNPDGTIDFTGFYGDYEITIDGETFDLSLVKGTTDYSLVVGSILPGDYNGDGTVDAADYTVWRDAMASGATSLLNEDASPGAVDEADYVVWKNHFGETAPSGAGTLTAVPEPASFLLWLAALTTLAAARRL